MIMKKMTVKKAKVVVKPMKYSAAMKKSCKGKY